MIMLFRLAPDQSLPKPSPNPATFQLLPQPRAAGAKTRTKRASGRAAPVKAPPKPPPPAPSKSPLNMLVLSKDEYAASDISKLPSHRDDRGTESADAGGGADKGSGSDKGSGEGPGGERLYPADWYRRPTHAELNTYLPATMQDGWGLIACQTVARYHVDNCRELGESPIGSGLARAVRQAAWQFLVLPPRINGNYYIHYVANVAWAHFEANSN